MDLKEHLIRLRKRAKSKVGRIIAGYEIESWPAGQLEELLDIGALEGLSDTQAIRCPGCHKNCSVEPIKEIANDGSEYYMVLCEIQGCVDIPEFHMHRYRITDKIDKLAPPTKKRKRLRKPELTRQQECVYRLIHAEGKTQAQAAHAMNCSPQNVSKLLHTAEEKIKLEGSKSISNSRSQKLPQDKRGQTFVSGNDGQEDDEL